jgi:ADP-heptose:LPS heptosyltransferase
VRPPRIAVLQGGGPDDALFALPAVRALRRAHPDAELDCVASVAAAPVLRLSPDPSGVRAIPASDPRLLDGARLLWHLRHTPYRLAVVPDGNLLAIVAAYLAGIPERVSLARGLARLLLTTPVTATPGQHRVNEALDVAAAVGASPDGPGLHLPVLPEASRAAADQARRWKAGLPLVALIPGGVPERQADRCWPPQRYALLARRLLEQYGVRIVLLGEPREQGLLEQVSMDIPFPVPAWLGLDEFPSALATLGQCAVVVANDSVWLHLAVAAGARCLGIYGVTAAALRGPYGSEHLAVQARLPVRPRRRGRDATLEGAESAMERVTVQDVLGALVTVLQRAGARAAEPSRH